MAGVVPLPLAPVGVMLPLALVLPEAPVGVVPVVLVAPALVVVLLPALVVPPVLLAPPMAPPVLSAPMPVVVVALPGVAAAGLSVVLAVLVPQALTRVPLRARANRARGSFGVGMREVESGKACLPIRATPKNGLPPKQLFSS